MKKFIIEFIKRGLAAASGGPIIIAIIYFILGKVGVIQTMTPNEVALGIVTSALLAFIIAGVSAVYQIDKLPTFPAALIHGIVLYSTYIIMYLINGWIKSQILSIIIFTVIFIVGYVLIWLIVYLSTKISARKLNSKISGKQ